MSLHVFSKLCKLCTYFGVLSVLAYDEISIVPLPSSRLHAHSACSPVTGSQLSPRAAATEHNNSKRPYKYITTKLSNSSNDSCDSHDHNYLQAYVTF